jgi:hypothetical protein
MNIKDTFTIMSRYGQPRVVTKVADNTYIIDGPSSYYRGGTTNDGDLYVDYSGGPFVCTGDSMSFYGGTEKERIKAITIIESSQEGFLTIEVLTQSKEEYALDRIAKLDYEMGLNDLED